MTEFISRKYGKEGYEIIIKTDSHEHYRATEDFARCLIDHSKPATNADRIRAISDEELAQMLATGKGTFTCLKCMEFIDRECSMKCDERCLEWLQQPAGGE